MVIPTGEQQETVEKFLTRQSLKIAAFAGAGKTTTLKMLAEATRARGVYLAFNRSIAAEAKERFPRSVDCRTTHAIAFRAVMPQYGSTPKLTKNLHANQLSQVMDYADRIFPGAFRLNGVHQAHLVLGTIRRFCQSSDPVIALDHVPKYGRLLGASEAVVAEVKEWAVAQANIVWARMTARNDDIPLGHDGYLKLWALSRPRLQADYILLDEAQDTNAVVLGVLADQPAQVIYVGDRHQQIYEWRGAVNAMEKITGCDEAALTQSFRFGPSIAATASRVLATLGEQRTIRGSDAVNSAIANTGTVDAVLARTNGTVILEVLEATRQGKRPCVCGGTQEIKRLLSDVYELKAGKPGVCPEFFGFQKWAEVVEFTDSEEGEGLRAFVQLVETHGEAKLWAAIGKAVSEEQGADVILSTAHKAKGREWDAVRLAPDFMNSRLGPGADAQAEVRLFYVAMTRAKKLLVAENELLKLFTTDEWKAKRPGPRPGSAPAAPTRRVTPASAPPRSQVAKSPNAATARRPPVREISRPAMKSPPQTPAPAITPPPQRATFWSRIARLFGG